MASQKVYILNYNGAVQYASKDVSALWGVICKMAQSINLPLPHSYEQVTRILNSSGEYIHSPGHAHSWSIISRELLYTKRASRKRAREFAAAELKEKSSSAAQVVVTEGENGRGATSSAG